MRYLLILLLFFGCSSKELDPSYVKKAIVNYFTPYSSITIAEPVEVSVKSIEKRAPNRAIAEVCYTFRFKRSYKELVRRIKENPNSFLARFDVGLVSLYGRKFGSFVAGDVKRRCDSVEFERRYGKWVISKI